MAYGPRGDTEALSEHPLGHSCRAEGGDLSGPLIGQRRNESLGDFQLTLGFHELV